LANIKGDRRRWIASRYWRGEIKEYYVQRGSGKLILQDIRFEKREEGTALSASRVE